MSANVTDIAADVPPPLPGGEGRFLRFRADRRTLLFVATYYTLVVVQFIYAPTNLLVAAPLLLLTCWFAFFGAVATHNSLHSPVFRQRSLNRVFQCFLTCTYGHPVSSYVPGHNLSHHKYTQTRRDVMRTTKVQYRWNLLNGILFMPTVGLAITPADRRYAKAMKLRKPEWYRQMQYEWLALGLWVIPWFFISWKKALLYVIIPHQYAAWGIITMNLLQHDGCDETSEYNHSRNFVGRIVNWWVYNNGYHSIHHEEPGLHWSLLPVEHAARIAPHIHPNLDQKSLVLYILRTFIFPAKRLNYDGTVMALPDPGPDEDWIPAPNETPKDVSLGAIA